VKVARDKTGTTYLEVHQDVLGGKRSELPAVLAHLSAARLMGAVDQARVEDVVTRAWGTPEDVSPHPQPAGEPAIPAGAVLSADPTPGGPPAVAR